LVDRKTIPDSVFTQAQFVRMTISLAGF